MIMRDRTTFLDSYFDALSKKSDIKIDKEFFRSLFDKKINYVAGYIKGYKVNTDSTYANS